MHEKALGIIHTYRLYTYLFFFWLFYDRAMKYRLFFSFYIFALHVRALTRTYFLLPIHIIKETKMIKINDFPSRYHAME